MYRMNTFERALHRLRTHYKKYVAAWFSGDDPESAFDVALLVPIAPKDLKRAAEALPKICENLAHPISDVCIVSPDDPEIRAFCHDRGYRWVDERTALAPILLPAAFDQLGGWICQQMIKLMAPEIAKSEHVVVFDSDTYPLRKVRFIDERGRLILNTSELTAERYPRFTKRLTGLEPYRDRGFIAHCMIIDQTTVNALRECIEKRHGKPWHESILDLLDEPVEKSGVMSEFEILGTFLARTMPERIVLRYRLNLKVPEKIFFHIGDLSWSRRRRFRFVSSHLHI